MEDGRQGLQVLLRVVLGLDGSNIEFFLGRLRALPLHVTVLATVIAFKGSCLLSRPVHIHGVRISRWWGHLCHPFVSGGRYCLFHPGRPKLSPPSLSDLVSLQIAIDLHQAGFEILVRGGQSRPPQIDLRNNLMSNEILQ